jgi:hypothetical protein
VLGFEVLLTGCIPYDAPSPVGEIYNERDDTVFIRIVGTDRVVKAVAHQGSLLPDRKCMGNGLAITDADGTELASYHGAVCPSTVVSLHHDGTIVVVDDSRTRAPISPSAGT